MNDEGGLNFATATHKTGDSLTLQLRRAGVAHSASVRLEGFPATPATDEYGLDPFARGVVITKVAGIAANQGFRPGDIVRAVNGRHVSTVAELAAALQASGWRITIDRGGREIDAEF